VQCGRQATGRRPHEGNAMMRITHDEVQQILAIVRRESAVLGKAICVAIVDAGGYIVAIERPEGGRPLTPTIALSMAYSAAVMQRPTNSYLGWAQNQPVFFSQVATMGWQPIVATLGGITFKRGEHSLGGVGIGGGT